MTETPCAPADGVPDARFLPQGVRRVIPALWAVVLTGLLAACTTPAKVPIVAQPAPRPYVAPPGLSRVMGKTPATVIVLLGSPRLDRTEGKTRQLQYIGSSCVLDLFAVGPVISYAESRTSAGKPSDPVACFEQLAPR